MVNDTAPREKLLASAFVFDWDDTLVESSKEQYEAMKQAFISFKQTDAGNGFNLESFLERFSYAEFRRMHANPEFTNLKIMMRHYVEEAFAEESEDRIGELSADVLHTYEEMRELSSRRAVLFPGAAENLLALAKKGIPFSIVSTKAQDMLIEAVDHAFRDAGLDNTFQIISLDEFGEPQNEPAGDKIPVYIQGRFEEKGWPRKPDPRQYLQVISTMDTLGAGEHIWSVGDKPAHDLVPIYGYGANGIIFGKHSTEEEIAETFSEDGISQIRGTDTVQQARNHSELAGIIDSMELAPPQKAEFLERDMSSLKASLLVDNVITTNETPAVSDKDKDFAVSGIANEDGRGRIEVARDVAETEIRQDIVAKMADALCAVQGNTQPVHIVFPDPMFSDGTGNALTVVGASVLAEKLSSALSERGRNDIVVLVDDSIECLTTSAQPSASAHEYYPSLARRPLFKGIPDPDAHYIVWSDHIGNGADAIDLANHINTNGGKTALITGISRDSSAALFQTDFARKELHDAILADALFMINRMRSNDIPASNIPSLGTRAQELTKYLDKALQRIGLTTESLTNEQTLNLTKRIQRYGPIRKGIETAPYRVFGCVNDILGELVKPQERKPVDETHSFIHHVIFEQERGLQR